MTKAKGFSSSTSLNERMRTSTPLQTLSVGNHSKESRAIKYANQNSKVCDPQT